MITLWQKFCLLNWGYESKIMKMSLFTFSSSLREDVLNPETSLVV